MSLETKNKSIDDIEMDHFGYSADRLSTTGVGNSIGFVVLLNNGRDLFVEHRSDIFLPQIITLKNVCSCFKNVAKHISEVFSNSNIT